MNKMLSFIFIIPLLLSLTACKFGENIIDGNREKAHKKLQEILKIRKNLPLEIDTNGFKLVSLGDENILVNYVKGKKIEIKGPRLVISRNKFEDESDIEIINACFVYEEDLQDLTIPESVQFRVKHDSFLVLNNAEALLESDKFITSDGDLFTFRNNGFFDKLANRDNAFKVKAVFTILSNLRYLCIIRNDMATPPIMIGEEGKRSFLPGMYQATVIIFDLDKRKDIGSYTLATTNNNTIEYSSFESDTEMKLSEQLRGNIMKVVFSGIQSFIPNSKICN